MDIILVHGFGDSGRRFAPLQRRLTAAGHRCYCPTLKPADARHGITDLAQKLAAYIEAQLPGSTPFAVVGFSMGCLIARSYLQQLGGAQRACALFAISGPHQGSWLAYGYPGQGCREMRRGSAFLQQLAQSVDALGPLPLFAYRTPFDLMVLPSRSAHWPQAHNRVVPSLLHRGMVSSRVVAEDILSQLARLDGQAN
mgnify:FL=1